MPSPPLLIKDRSCAYYAIRLELNCKWGSLCFSRLSNVKSLGFKVITVPASLGANALMFTVRLFAIDMAYQGISPGLVVANAAAETL